MGKQLTESTTLSKRKVSHKGARQKGLQFEREIANALGHIFPEAQRKLECQASANAIEGGIDIDGCDRLKIQCKNKQNYVPVSTINEIRTKDPSHIPILVTKGNRMEPMAVLPFAKLVTLLEIAYGLELPFRTFDAEPNLKEIAPMILEEALKLPSPQKEKAIADRIAYMTGGRVIIEADFDCPKECNALDSII